MKIAIIGETLFATKADLFFKQMFDAQTVLFPKCLTNDQSILNIQKSKIDTMIDHSRKRILKNFRIIIKNKNKFDTYLEFDLVIDARSKFIGQRLLETGGVCLNEKNESVQKFFLHNIDLKQETSLALFVDSENLALCEDILSQWLYQDSSRKLYLCCNQKINFQLNIFEKYDSEWNEQVSTFLNEIDQWKNLENEQKIKKTKPKEPEKRITLLNDWRVFSLEKMEDQENLFMLFESVDQENENLKTISVEKILVLRNNTSCHADFSDRILDGLMLQSNLQTNQSYNENLKENNKTTDSLQIFTNEPGFYKYRNYYDNEDDVTKSLIKVKKDILTFFTEK